MFICGTGNFSDGERDTTPGARRSKRTCRILSKEFSNNSSNRNPYADRGLDKFYALLAELDDKKQKIYTRLGSEDISFVRFVYSNDETNHVKPIVVKAKERSREKGNTATNLVKHLASNNSNNRIRNDEINAVVDKEEIVPEQKSDDQQRRKRRYLRCKGSFSLESLRQPYWYVLAIVALIMVSLAVFGRSFAILCTSIGWYLVPSVVGGSSSPSSPNERKPERKPKRKTELLSRLSERKMNVHSEDVSSPRSVINGLPDHGRKVQKQHHDQKKKLLKISSI